MRDKLIELIDDNKACTLACSCHECRYNEEKACFAPRLADELIAHGITLAEDNNVLGKKPLTNADRIRGMTDEELAYWMTHLHEDGHCLNKRCQIFEDKTCEECVIDWLKQPAKEVE